MLVAEAAIDTDEATFGLTVMTTWFDVAGDPVTQVAFDVITQVMMSPFDKLEVV
jgi:hypothetical protein